MKKTMTLFAWINTVASIFVLLKDHPFMVYLWKQLVAVSDSARRYIMGCQFEREGEWVNYIFAVNDKKYLTDRYYAIPEDPNKEIMMLELSNLVIVRILDMERLYGYRRGCFVLPNKIHIPNLMEAKRVESPVLSVQYNHPNVEPPISMEISDEYWIEGNELFSAAFVGRWLDYYVGPHVPFDLQYTLSLVVINGDGDIEVITLGPTEYIRILERGFEVIKLDSESEIIESESDSNSAKLDLDSDSDLVEPETLKIRIRI